jgi:hypothetical protein
MLETVSNSFGSMVLRLIHSLEIPSIRIAIST